MNCVWWICDFDSQFRFRFYFPDLPHVMPIWRSRKRRKRLVRRRVWSQFRTQSNWVCWTVDYFRSVSSFRFGFNKSFWVKISTTTSRLFATHTLKRLWCSRFENKRSQCLAPWWNAITQFHPMTLVDLLLLWTRAEWIGTSSTIAAETAAAAVAPRHKVSIECVHIWASSNYDSGSFQQRQP